MNPPLPRFRSCLGAAPFLASLIVVMSSAWAAEDGIDFSTEIGPLLREKCGKCHSESVRKGDLDLSTARGLVAGGESGEPLIAETLEESWLWHVISSGEMPPEDEPALTSDEVNRIRQWLQQGESAIDSAALTEHTPSIHDVLPILLLRCTPCHGPQRQDGGLDLRTHASMIQGGESGPAMIPGNPDDSLMVQRIETEACPPRDLLLKFFVRRPSSAEREKLRDWIAQGAPPGDIHPDIASTTPDPLVTDEDRQHWAFQPARPPAVGATLDDFIEAKLDAAGLTLSPQADRDTLIRRVYMDLIGMPPSLEAWRRWHQHPASDWYTQMVDEVLASPHYGERWGRYWLDLAGYADSEGGVSADPIRPVAWKYRDYVIRAFNDDKPYDQFLLEQLAGDELVDHANQKELTAEMMDPLIATGFLRMGIDETGSRTMNFVPERLKVISDAITVVSSGLMGLTMECARCHSHKYDPIPQRDYYRLKAVFQGALDEHDWKSFKTRTLALGTSEHRAAVASINPPLEKELKRLQSQHKGMLSELNLTLLRHHFPEQSEDDNQATLTALRVADNTRTLPQRLLVERLQRAEVKPDAEQSPAVLELRQQIQALEREIQQVQRTMVPPLTIRALWDSGRPSPTYVLQRGEHDKPGRLVGPGVPSVLTDGKTPFEAIPPFPDGTPKTGRRLAFAKWLTHPDHPLTSRVMVNRIWFHHFGQGLVKSLDNFGVKGERPTHPELLDWLAVEFVKANWSIKTMHRIILNSKTYRQSIEVTDEHRERDPQNQLYSRMSLRRLDAEALRDSMLFVSGKLDPTPGGLPDPVSVDREGLVQIEPTAGQAWRRSVYAQYRRTEIPTMLDTFDYPQMGPNCLQRSVSNVSPQSLLLMNDQHVRDLARSLAERVGTSTDGRSSGTHRDQVERVYQIALSRLPSDEEIRLAENTLNELESAWNGDSQKALESYCHALLNSAAFLYVD